jgi:hypothetical protein
MIKKILMLIISSFIIANAQVEHVPVSHPVYNYLIQQESKGLLPHFSSDQLPLKRIEISEALKQIRKETSELNNFELKALELFEIEFEIVPRQNSVVFYSKSDSNQILLNGLISEDEKFFYHYRDSSASVNLLPLANLDYSNYRSDSLNDYALMGNLGFRLHGSLSNMIGYYLQVTNGTLFTGNKSIALLDHRLHQNIKFSELNSDFDFTESHVSFCYDWFNASIGRETRLNGSGLTQRLFVSTNSPPIDGVTIGAHFSNFRYTHTSYSLLGLPDSALMKVGFKTYLSSKILAMHKFTLLPEWGEISFWDAVLYSGRGYDVSYLNPLSFYKSLEHANRDRDNSIMGFDWTLRPAKGIQITGSFILDDIIFSEIGTGYWSNKTAFNLGISYTSKLGLAGIEYARVEPYTFSHYNPENSYTNDKQLIGSNLSPNSDQISLLLRFYWLGNRYPWTFRFAYLRQGVNVYDNEGKLIKNVGSDPAIVRGSNDDYYVTFLNGNRIDAKVLELNFAYEVIRGFNINCFLYLKHQMNGASYSNFRMIFSFSDF